MKTLNAQGKDCPEPVAMTKAQVDRGETELEVLLDNPVSASNVMRFLESNGFTVQLKDDEGAITISARKADQLVKPAAFKKQPPAPARASEADAPEPQTAETPAPALAVNAASQDSDSGTLSILITGSAIGRNDTELGETLMKSFLSVLPQMDKPPVAVGLVNEGVKLALYDSSSCDHLKSLEQKGAAVLVCGMCANHFNIMDQIGVGSISNMFEIIETLNRAGKTMTV